MEEVPGGAPPSPEAKHPDQAREPYLLRRIWDRVGVPGRPLMDTNSFCPPTCGVLSGTVSRNALATLALRCGSELSAWKGKAGTRKQRG